MNVLFVGSTKPTSTSVYYHKALQDSGHRVITWEPGYFETRTPVAKIVQRLNRGPTSFKVDAINRKLVSLCLENFFDLVFVMGENYITEETLYEIRSKASRAPKFLFHSHDNLFAEGILKHSGFFQALASFDIAFTTKSQNVERYRAVGQHNGHYIPSAYEPSIHKPVDKTSSRFSREFDVGFIGTYDGSRDRWLEKAGWNRLQVWGNGWKRFEQYPAYQNRIVPEAIYGFDFADAVSRTRCSLGLLREEAGDRHTQRTFEIPACGSLQFAPRNEEIQGFFEDGKEIILFDSPEELKEKLDYYLSHPEEASKIAQAGYERCIAGKHSYADRVKIMLEKL